MKEKFKRFIALLLILVIILPVQELRVFAETVSENEVTEEDSHNGQVTNPIEPKTVSGEDMGEETLPKADVTGKEFSHAGVNEEGMPSAPIHHCAPDYTDFSYVYFGSYPQSEVTDNATIAAIENAISTSGTEANVDVGIDVLIDGIKYRRISRSDTNYSGYFGDSDYRYFKWEKIKWKVLQNDGNTLFVMSDKALDCKAYHDTDGEITWENSTIRSWLNSSFYNTAFNSKEQEAVVEQVVVNKDNSEWGTEGGNDTRDKVYLLSLDEVTKESYGFCSDSDTVSLSRKIKASDYAHVRGTRRDYHNDSGWWLRSPGLNSSLAANVDSDGWVDEVGYDAIDSYYYGSSRPALHINLQSAFWSMWEDGGVREPAIQIEEGIPANPIHHCPAKEGITDCTNWDCIYFGSYPQNEVTDSAVIADIENAINILGTGASVGTDIDVLVDGIKYRRVGKKDLNNDRYFGDSDYRYFKWEKIKWKVLQNDGNTLFVMSDKALDCKAYHDAGGEITWKNSTIRSWLNSSFYNTAFNSEEQLAVVEQIVVNKENSEWGTEGGNDTKDKVYLLSLDEVTKESYGFCSDSSTHSESRRIKASDYAVARGIWSDNDDNYGCWWLRSPGYCSGDAVHVDSDGWVDRYGCDVDYGRVGVCPALHINLSSDIWSMADDSTSGEGENGGGDNGRVQPPKADIPGGTYTAPLKITLDSATVGAEIYYTINGTTPTKTSIKYTAPITITSSIVLKAIAIKSGYENSQIMTETYTISIPENPSADPANPVHYCNTEDETQDTATWSYVYFGSYPQSEVTDETTKWAIDSAINQGNGQPVGTAGSSEGIDVWVNGTKFRRISKDDTNDSYYFDNVENNGYRYFKWERIKWRVLQNDGKTLFVVADKAVDCKFYTEEYTSLTWETSGLRKWLNNHFYNTAFGSNEQNAITEQTVVNEDSPFMEQQANTNDRVYLLSISEVKNKKYGFCSEYRTNSMSRRTKASDYAKARGALEYDNGTYKENCAWWLRSPGLVESSGKVNRGEYVDTGDIGVCPALHINLSSGAWPIALKSLQASKVKTEYIQGEALNLDDLTVTAVYENSSQKLPTGSYTTNAVAIDMNTPGKKTLTISYTEGTITKTAAITITVNQNTNTTSQAKKGTQITDPTSNGKYTVTSTDSKNPTVSYDGSTDPNAKSVTIPEYITYNGVQYKVTTVSTKSFQETKSSGQYTVTDNQVGNLTVEYTGTTNKNKKTITIPEYVTYQGVKYKVTSVKAKSFKGNKKLTTIKIASSITKIGDSAFEGCNSLKTVTIGTGLKTIGKNAFKNCKKLKTLTIKSSKLKTVGKNAFKGIYAKCKVKVPAKKVKAYIKLMKNKGQKATVKIGK